jgi:hypothetical protein
LKTENDMPGDAPNSRTKTENTRTFDGKPPAELPKEVEKAIWLAVRRAVNGLKREVEAKRPRTVVEKHTHFDTRQFADVLLALRRESDRAEALVKEIRTEREKILRIVKPEMFSS